MVVGVTNVRTEVETRVLIYGSQYAQVEPMMKRNRIKLATGQVRVELAVPIPFVDRGHGVAEIFVTECCLAPRITCVNHRLEVRNNEG